MAYNSALCVVWAFAAIVFFVYGRQDLGIGSVIASAIFSVAASIDKQTPYAELAQKIADWHKELRLDKKKGVK